MLRTIWWQNDVAAMSKRVIAPKCVVDETPLRDGEPANELGAALAGVDVGPATERREVVIADQAGAAVVHRREIEWGPHMPCRAARRAGSDGVVPDVVVVATGGCGEAGREVGSPPTRAERTAMSGRHSPLRLRWRRPRSVSSGISPVTTCPQPCTPASVRPAPVSSTGWRTTRRHGRREFTHDGTQLAVDGEAVEIGAVVGDGEPYIAHVRLFHVNLRRRGKRQRRG